NEVNYRWLIANPGPAPVGEASYEAFYIILFLSLPAPRFCCRTNRGFNKSRGCYQPGHRFFYS
ncbi:MAG TPA: hypothetical protein PLG08_14980, partial [Chitinophagaceae bacterium]|nr:hypothetical protein [Chitinophagaceae bacterium]